MNSNRKIVLVTGSNKGIGYGIIKIIIKRKKYLE
jgi:NAD(P)-dependent dehydrogenase (short-subunit alcohol dehydrogenase family)